MNPYQLAGLGNEHDLSSFDCGEDSLNRYLINEAWAAQRSGESRTHVWLDDRSAVCAYFTVMLTTVVPDDLPRSARIGSHKHIPGYRLAKLALAVPLRGKGLGPDLLVDALGVIVSAADAVGGRVIVVDSLQNTKVHNFYCSADFQPLEGSYTLWMPLESARSALHMTG